MIGNASPRTVPVRKSRCPGNGRRGHNCGHSWHAQEYCAQKKAEEIRSAQNQETTTRGRDDCRSAGVRTVAARMGSTIRAVVFSAAGEVFPFAVRRLGRDAAAQPQDRREWIRGQSRFRPRRKSGLSPPRYSPRIARFIWPRDASVPASKRVPRAPRPGASPPWPAREPGP
jgi:hypothetical protein